MNIKTAAACAALGLLSMASSAAVVGQLGSATISANGNNLSLGTLSAAQSGDLYISLDINFLAGVINDNDFVALWLDNGSTSSDHTTRPNIGLKPNSAAGGADYFVRTSGTGGAFDTPPPQAAVGNTVSLFGHLYKTGGSSVYNRFDLWLNGDLGDLPGLLATTPNATFSGPSSGLTSISNFGIRAANLDSGDQVQVSNVLIRNSVPEPASFGLVGLAAAAAALASRRRRSA